MMQRYAIWTVGLCLALSGCAITPRQAGTTTVLQFYTGAPKPMPDIAILKSTDIPAARHRGNEEIKIELRGINDRRFKGSGGLGDGTFEVHLWPGTYTLHLRYSSTIDDDGKIKTLESTKDQDVTLVAAAGHVYLLNGDRVSDANDNNLSWIPVIFDKARVIAWRRDEPRALLLQQSAAR